MKTSHPLLVLETHPVQYHAPVFRALNEIGVPIVVGYGSDFSVTGYEDHEFEKSISWDNDLLVGYESRIMSSARDGGPKSRKQVTAAGIAGLIREVQPAATLICGYGTSFDRSALRYSRKDKIPVLFRAETTDHAVRRNWIKGTLRSLALRRIYSQCARLLFVGQNSLDHYRRLGVENEKLIRSPYCVDTSNFNLKELQRETIRDSFRSANGISNEQFLLLYSGKLIHRKGVHLLIPAIRNLNQELKSKIVLGLLGAGTLLPELQRAAAEEPAVELRSFGFQNQTQLSPFYHAADALVLPSLRSETWGLVVNEALHHGLPAIVSENVGSAPDLIRQNQTGFVFDSNNIPRLTNAIEKVAQLSRSTQTQHACRHQVANYTVAVAAAGIKLAFEQVRCR